MGDAMRVLVVEDEKKLAGFIKRALKEDGHAVELCHDGDEAGQLAAAEAFDAIVLDLQLPGRDGLMILRELRKKGADTPVLILTARDTVKDRVRGLDEGADDYLTKPFALDELRARLRVLFRRGKAGTSILKFADLTLNLIDRLVLRGTREIELTAKEFSLLEFFLRNPRKALRGGGAAAGANPLGSGEVRASGPPPRGPGMARLLRRVGRSVPDERRSASSPGPRRRESGRALVADPPARGVAAAEGDALPRGRRRRPL